MATKKATKKTKVKKVEVVEEVKAPEVEAEDTPTIEAVEEPITVEDIEKVEKIMEAPEVKKFEVHTKGGFIKMQSYRTPIPMYQIPEDIRKYLLRKGFGTNVWEKSDEWLEKHHADKEMIEKLKKFISENYL